VKPQAFFPFKFMLWEKQNYEVPMGYKMLRKVVEAELLNGDLITYNMSNYYLYIYNSATPKDTGGEHSMAFFSLFLGIL
jgi:hypothetical protein